MAFKTKQAALKAARKALGAETLENVDFILRNTGAGWVHEEVPAANEPAKKARAKRARKDLPEVEMVGDQIVSGHRRAAKAAEQKRPVVARDVTTGKVSLKMAVPKSEPAPKRRPPEPRTIPTPAGQTKTEMLVGMMTRTGGATSKEMEQATGWAPHSVRGLVGTLKKRGVKVISTKEQGSPTSYSIAPTQDVGDVL